eukprot:s128_g23.t1
MLQCGAVAPSYELVCNPPKEPVAAALKHRVACVTCRSRLEPLVTNLVTFSASSSKGPKPATSSQEPEGMNRPLPLTSWLSADESRGLEPAPCARQDIGALAAFLASFGGGSSLDEMAEEPLRRSSGRGSGVLRCQYHAQYCGCGFRCSCCAPRGFSRTKKGGAANTTPALAEAATLAALQPDLLASYEKERFVAVLQSGTSEAEWRQLGTVDLDALCELFFWLSERGLLPIPNHTQLDGLSPRDQDCAMFGKGAAVSLSSKEDAVGLSSPEFSALLPKLDAKMAPVTTFRMKGPKCLQMVHSLRNTHPTLKHPGVIHTGILLPEGADDMDGWEIFAPLLEQYGKYIEIKRFDAAAEIKKVCSHYEANVESFSNLTEELVKMYEAQDFVGSKSNLMRTFLLYNYGGAWMDSDTLLVQSLSPLLEEEWPRTV